MYKSLLVKISLSLFGTIFALLLLEIGLRVCIAPKAHAAKLDRPSADYMPAGSLNRFRDRHHKWEKPVGTFRILAVGDSFTYAGKVLPQDSYSSLLGEFFNNSGASNNIKFEVIKAAMPGLNATREAHLFVTMFERYHPDLVVHQLFLNDAEEVPFEYSDYGHVVASLDAALESKFLTYSYGLSLVFDRVRRKVVHDQTIKYYEDLYSNPQRWQAFRGAVRGIRDYARERNAQFFAFLFPALGGDLTQERYPFLGIHQQIQEFMDKRKIPYLDLLHEYFDLDPVRLQAIPGIDSHPNEISHRIAAEAIFKSLLNYQLVPLPKTLDFGVHLGPTKE
ncbi:MAG: SGNH/GDSL hydrolase family protein [Bdellovibrionales bacterium]|nr:SGNH/GDSL hydrolase family protein [Bdellovibrionales bacterium]